MDKDTLDEVERQLKGQLVAFQNAGVEEADEVLGLALEMIKELRKEAV